MAAEDTPGTSTLTDERGVGELAGLIARLPAERRRRALTHSSWTGNRTESYERLAFLGDSVLGLVVADEVYGRYPDVSAGRLSQIANQSVSGVACADVGRSLGVPRMVTANEPDEPADRMTAESLLAGGRPLPEITEALIGACFLEFGYEPASAAVRSAFAARVDLAAETMIDFKSALQELLAQRGDKVEYRVTAETGPAHRRHFKVEARVGGSVLGRGEGPAKKAAEQSAAEQALNRLQK